MAWITRADPLGRSDGAASNRSGSRRLRRLAPRAIFPAASGQWGKAVILLLWGTVVVGLIDNLLYPILVGKRLRLHTVPVFFAIVGGLAVFGAAGIILGPVILALTDAILEIWRRRMAAGRPAEEASRSSWIERECRRV